MTATADETTATKIFDAMTRVALAIALAAVATRVVSSEILRDAGTLANVIGDAAPSPPGPTTIVWMNLLCWLPAVLVLLRRAFDTRYVLRTPKSFYVLLALCAWVMISPLWASDRFAAVVSASTWCSAAALAWAASQFVRTWTRLRLVAGFFVGLSLVFVVNAAYFRFEEWPSMKSEWATNTKNLLLKQSPPPDPWTVQQLETNVNSGAPLGFFVSANSFAAVLAMASLASLALAVQRLRDKDESGFVAAIAGPAIVSVYFIVLTNSRTALAGLVLCALAIAIYCWKADWLARHRRVLFWAGAAIVAAGVAAMVMVGITTGGLLQDSLNFRWNYWIGSAGVLAERPLGGTGWANFGSAYLPHRVVSAVEEIKDPHNFFVTFFATTGIVGGLLAIAWVGRFAWEATRETSPAPAATPPAARVLPLACGIAAGFVVLRLIVSGILFRPGFELVIELMKTGLYATLLIVGVLLGGTRTSMQNDDRPAPWLLAILIIAGGGFLLHTMVDFAMFETGPLLMFMLLLGSVVGLRQPSVAGLKRHTPAVLALLGGVFVLLLTYAALVAIPVTIAERYSEDARDLVNRQLPAEAVVAYRQAYDTAPALNPYYAQRAADISERRGAWREAVALRTLAITADQANASLWRDRALAGRSARDPAVLSADAIVQDYHAAVTRDPSNGKLRAEFGDFLMELNRPAEAKQQYEHAIWINDRLDPNERRRLPADVLDRMRAIVGKASPNP